VLLPTPLVVPSPYIFVIDPLAVQFVEIGQVALFLMSMLVVGGAGDGAGGLS
jgi:hypothetical protein